MNRIETRADDLGPVRGAPPEKRARTLLFELTRRPGRTLEIHYDADGEPTRAQLREDRGGPERGRIASSPGLDAAQLLVAESRVVVVDERRRDDGTVVVFGPAEGEAAESPAIEVDDDAPEPPSPELEVDAPAPPAPEVEEAAAPAAPRPKATRSKNAGPIELPPLGAAIARPLLHTRLGYSTSFLHAAVAAGDITGTTPGPGAVATVEVDAKLVAWLEARGWSVTHSEAAQSAWLYAGPFKARKAPKPEPAEPKNPARETPTTKQEKPDVEARLHGHREVAMSGDGQAGSPAAAWIDELPEIRDAGPETAERAAAGTGEPMEPVPPHGILSAEAEAVLQRVDEAMAVALAETLDQVADELALVEDVLDRHAGRSAVLRGLTWAVQRLGDTLRDARTLAAPFRPAPERPAAPRTPADR